MQVKDIMTRNVEMINPQATVTKAAQKMQCFDIGVIPVSEGNKVIGMVTGRDIVMRTVAEGRDPQRTTVREIMTQKVHCCSQDESIDQAAQIMEEKHIHRLVVCDQNNLPVGMLSLADFAVKSRNEHLTWEVLEKVCEPAHPCR